MHGAHRREAIAYEVPDPHPHTTSRYARHATPNSVGVKQAPYSPLK
jgi:hypothetical protein